MKNITRLSLVLIIFSAFYFITTVHAQAPGSAAAGHMNQAAPGSAAAGHMNSGGNDCMQHPAGPARDTCFQNSNP